MATQLNIEYNAKDIGHMKQLSKALGIAAGLVAEGCSRMSDAFAEYEENRQAIEEGASVDQEKSE